MYLFSFLRQKRGKIPLGGLRADGRAGTISITLMKNGRRIMEQITAVNLSHTYESQKTPSLDRVSFSIAAGEFIAIVGHNSSGKSTLARHLNGLLPLQSGELTVCSINAKLEANVWKLRRACGMVFQNPDNQFVSSIVSEDIAFGLENYQVPQDQIPKRVDEALQMVGMAGMQQRATHMLSGGQKQRIALAGVLALSPDVIIFDEATSMLDPQGREEVLQIIHRLHTQQRKTILLITHYMEEAACADRVFLMDHGRLLLCGTPREVFTQPKLLKSAGLEPPLCVQLYLDLARAGVTLPQCPLSNEDLVEALCQLQ